MALTINTNPMSLNSQRNLAINTSNLAKSMERLSSGYRINRAGDDAAGLQISENLRAQVRGSKAALNNVQDGINVLNIADGALQAVTNNIQRMRELAVQAANDTYGTTERAAIKAEMDQLSNEIDRISDATEFNGVQLLNGSADGAGNFNLQIGPESAAGTNTLDLGNSNAFNDVNVTALTINTANLVVTNTANAQTTIGRIDTALSAINTQRSEIGSFTNRLESTAQNLMVSIENMSATESRIRNVDVASESAELVRHQILQQASAAMLSQANQAPGLALSLLG